MLDPVDTLVRALHGPGSWRSQKTKDAALAAARALLAQITPAIVAQAVADAVAEERERCAKVAESSNTAVFKSDWTTSQDAAAISTMMAIAAAIRAGGE